MWRGRFRTPQTGTKTPQKQGEVQVSCSLCVCRFKHLISLQLVTGERCFAINHPRARVFSLSYSYKLSSVTWADLNPGPGRPDKPVPLRDSPFATRRPWRGRRLQRRQCRPWRGGRSRRRWPPRSSYDELWSPGHTFYCRGSTDAASSRDLKSKFKMVTDVTRTRRWDSQGLKVWNSLPEIR